MSGGAPLDWDGTVATAAAQGRLMELLSALPRERWHEQQGPSTLLHFACRGNNAAAVVALLAHGVRADTDWSAAHEATMYNQPEMLALLCAAGACIDGRDCGTLTPLELTLNQLPGTPECARVLVANGVRLPSARDPYCHLVKHDLVEFERGVLRCRAATVALLALKRRRGFFAMLDRWMAREIALAVWATRTHRAWQPSQDVQPRAAPRHRCAAQ